MADRRHQPEMIARRQLLAVHAGLLLAGFLASGCDTFRASIDDGPFAEFDGCTELRQRIRDLQANEFTFEVPDGAAERADLIDCRIDDFVCLERAAVPRPDGAAVPPDAVEQCQDLRAEIEAELAT